MLFSGVDQETWRLVTPGRVTPLMRAQELAAEAWGASRTWFITNGASGGNHIATTLVRALGTDLVVQRSVHSSVIDGITHVGLNPHFVTGHVDTGLGSAHGVTAEQVREVLDATPRERRPSTLSPPSYFGAVADIDAIATGRPRSWCAPDRGRVVGLTLRTAPEAARERRSPRRGPRHLEHAQGRWVPDAVGNDPAGQRPDTPPRSHRSLTAWCARTSRRAAARCCSPPSTRRG